MTPEERQKRIDELKLTDRQKKFCDNYALNAFTNASDAMRKAGYVGKNASATAQQTLVYPKVKTYIEILKSDIAGRVYITIDQLLQELKNIGFSRMNRFVTWDNDGVQLKSNKYLNDEDMAAISEIVQTDTKEGRKIRIKLHNKQPALDKLMDFVMLADGMKGRKLPDPGDEPKAIDHKKLTKLIADPRMRMAFELIAGQMQQVGEIPKMPRAMKASLDKIVNGHAIEYLPPSADGSEADRADMVDASPVDENPREDHDE